MFAITKKSAWGIALGVLVTGIFISYALVSDVLKPTGATSRAAPDAPTEARLATAYGKLPLSFEVNRGQTDPRVKFIARGQGYALYLTPTEGVLALRKAAQSDNEESNHSQAQAPRSNPAVLRLQLIGANPTPRVMGQEQLPGKVNYFIGSDRHQWQTNIPTYARVHYQDIYPGIDLVYYGNQRQLEYDFVVAPGADPSAIRLGFEGADKLTLDTEGNLNLHLAGGEVVLHAPVIYQQIDGVKETVPGHYVLKGEHEVGFQVAAYNAARPLLIDPVLSLAYSTFLGGMAVDEGRGIAVDAAGNAYITGVTESTDFPTMSPIQPAHGGGSNPPFQFEDVFVAKLNATGSALIYSTYLGGSSGERGSSIAVNAAGDAYVTGLTTSTTDFPTMSPIQATFGGVLDAFVAKLNATGSALIFSTYLGGSGADQGDGIAVDAAGDAYVTGGTDSSNFPTVSPIQPALNGFRNAFVTKLDATGSALIFSTYLGGSGVDRGGDIAVDTDGNTYVTGGTTSPNFPGAAASPIQSTHGGNFLIGFSDAFVAKLNATGSVLIYSTYLGGDDEDRGSGIAADAAGDAYVTGFTFSSDFPTMNPLLPVSFRPNAFVAKVNAAGTALVYSTHLGGSGFDIGRRIAVDAAGNAYITGETTGGFPVAGLSPLQATHGGGSFDAFVAKIKVDSDGDGIFDEVDNCPTVPNPGQEQTGNNVGGPFGDACVHPTVQLPPDLVIGANPIIGAGTTIEEGDPGATPPIPVVVIGDNAQIGANVQIKQSVTVGNNVILGAETILEINVTLGDGVVLGSSVELGKVMIEENVVIGNFVTILDDSVVKKEAMIGNDVSIADFVTIEDLARIGAGAVIETGVMINKNACVGMSTTIGANATIGDRAQIGNGETIMAGATIPADAIVGLLACNAP